MNVKEAIETRRSIRKYLQTPVEEEKLRLVLDAARLAPSARNDQKWRFIAVRDDAKRQLLCEAAFDQPFVKEAPVVIVACGMEPRFMSCGMPTDIVDVSIAVSYITLQACELGLGTCWLGHFDAQKVRAALGIPEDVSVVAVTPLGYPAQNPDPRPRKAFDEVVSYDKW